MEKTIDLIEIWKLACADKKYQKFDVLTTGGYYCNHIEIGVDQSLRLHKNNFQQTFITFMNIRKDITENEYNDLHTLFIKNMGNGTKKAEDILIKEFNL